MRIAIFGLGYVGCVNAGCLAELGHQVIGNDVKTEKGDKINEGISPIVEPGLSDLIKKHSGTNLRATASVQEAVDNSDMGLLCVGTPIGENGFTNTSFVERACEEISKVIDGNYVLCIRSTIPPGTIDKIKSKLGNDKLTLVSYPEFLREGNAIDDFFDPNIIVIGSEDKEISKKVREITQDISANVFETDVKNAEMIKYLNNSWHALKIAFTNEVSSIASSLGSNPTELMEIFLADKRLNVSKKYHKPGFAYGGSCLTKDPDALITMAHSQGVKIPIIEHIGKSNEDHIERAAKKIKNLGKKKLGFLGLSFKYDGSSFDVRSSPIIKLINLLKDSHEIKIYDPYLDPQELEKAADYDISFFEQSLEKIINSSEILVIGPSYPEFRGLFEKISSGIQILDLNGSLSDEGKGKKGYIGLY